MPLMPSRVKFRAQQRMSRAGDASRNVELNFGEYGLQTLDRAWVTSTQIEACRVAVSRHMKRRGKMWLRIFPDKPITKKPLEVRMGKGKGSVEYWVAQIKPGTMLYEVQGVPEQLAREAFLLAAAKLPVKTTFAARTIM